MFMPRDEAWAAFLAEVGSSVDGLKQSKDTLTDLLMYHITSGAVTEDKMLPDTVIPMSNVADVHVSSLWDYSTVLNDEAGRTISVNGWDIMAGISVGQKTDG